MRQSKMWAGAALAMVTVLGGRVVQATPRCAQVCADDVRACVVAAKATHPCARLQPTEAKQCRLDRLAARHACHRLRTECRAGRKVCSGQ